MSKRPVMKSLWCPRRQPVTMEEHLRRFGWRSAAPEVKKTIWRLLATESTEYLWCLCWRPVTKAMETLWKPVMKETL